MQCMTGHQNQKADSGMMPVAVRMIGRAAPIARIAMHEDTTMTPVGLHARVAAALEITGLPAWPCADGAAAVESLQFFGAGEVEEVPIWAFVAPEGVVAGGAPEPAPASDSTVVASDRGLPPEVAEDDSMSDYEPIPTELARRLIGDHLRDWLAARGWQVQAVVSRTGRHWRLADCLSLAQGGGDRLDADYPCGDDELAVLCDSVVAIHTGAKPGKDVSLS